MKLRVFALALLACAAPRAAFAQKHDPAAAQALFEEARVLLAKGDYAAACAKLEGSQALDPGAGTQYNLALCYEKSGRTASAWAAYLEAAAAYKATSRPEWETKARDRAAVLAVSLSKLTIVAPADAPADLVVTRDGVVVVRSELGAAIPLDPGAHVVEAASVGRPKFHASVDVPRATTSVVTIMLAEPSPVAPPPPKPVAPEGAPSHTLAYVIGGVGLAGLLVGGITGLVAMNKNNASTNVCPNDGVCPDANARRDSRSASTFAAVSTVGFIAGGVLVASGVVLYFVAPGSKPSASVSPYVGLGRAGLSGRW